MKIVEVEWVDSISEGRWQDKDEAIRSSTREVMLHRSVGYLVHENEHMILLAGGRSEENSNVCDTMQIPRVAVLNVHNLLIAEVL